LEIDVMKRFACLSVAFALAATLVVTAAVGADQKTPSIKDVMGKLYKGPNASMSKLKNELNATPPEWKQVQGRTKDFVTLAEALAKNEPRKGDKASFKKLQVARRRGPEARPKGFPRRVEENRRLLHGLPPGTPRQVTPPARIVRGPPAPPRAGLGL
jgi:hypothetical protein